MYYAAPYFITAGRVLMAIMFIQSWREKIFGYAGAQGYMEAHGVPGVLLPLVILTEAGGGLCVLLGLFTRPVAIAFPPSVCSPRCSSIGIQKIRCK